MGGNEAEAREEARRSWWISGKDTEEEIASVMAKEAEGKEAELVLEMEVEMEEKERRRAIS